VGAGEAKDKMISLTKKIRFCAAHWLNSPELSPEENKRIYGKDNNPDRHGHNYELEVTVEGEVNPKTGLVMNLVDLKKILIDEIYDKVDHRDLTSDVDFLQDVLPSSENLVIVFWSRIQNSLPGHVRLAKVRLYETDTGWVTYVGPSSGE